METEVLNKLSTLEEYNLNSLILKYVEGCYYTRRINSELNGLTPWKALYEKSTKSAAIPCLSVHYAEEVDSINDCLNICYAHSHQQTNYQGIKRAVRKVIVGTIKKPTLCEQNSLFKIPFFISL